MWASSARTSELLDEAFNAATGSSATRSEHQRALRLMQDEIERIEEKIFHVKCDSGRRELKEEIVLKMGALARALLLAQAEIVKTA